ncbi:PhzF family phenazine biosynthesis protein [Paractinoplanes durhamensis]|uniref:Oxidoreductase n=1 Tax=Paractinoplanes durhamensis TaxID=113563 RepID=A0ABQ3YZZ4_9ACTN|nr:PhzF family phenazine biosynthesis protein [Actinoplanes durhamensis]GIE03100.1 oxidoreductase [Actinoplanes durhamensis]
MRIRIIDAFTDRPFAGNPAGVCLLDAGDWPDETWMRRVAAELNLSETAFARPLGSGGEDWALRWFTPAVEVKLCGHATLATAHALATDAGGPGTYRFETLSGLLTARVAGDGLITLDFPVSPPVEVPAPAGLTAALGATAEAIFWSEQLGDLLAVLQDETCVRTLRPDLRAVAGLRPGTGMRGVVVTAPADPGGDHDFVSRFFGPAVGVDEDPVTGSAHTMLAPYWSQRLGRTELTGLQVSARSGVVGTAVRGDRVELTGRAVTVLDGTLLHRP